MCLLLLILKYGTCSTNFIANCICFFRLYFRTVMRGNPRLAGGYLGEWFESSHRELFYSENMETTKKLNIKQKSYFHEWRSKSRS